MAKAITTNRIKENGGRPATPRPRVALLILAASSLAACLDATQVTLEITTDVDCSDISGTTITVGRPDEMETRSILTSTVSCTSGRVGSFVVVPSGEDNAEFAVKIVTGLQVTGTLEKACTGPDYGPNCIVARRELRFLPHTNLTLPIRMSSTCEGLFCSKHETCANGSCVSARFDAEICAPVCDEDALPLCYPGSVRACYEGPAGTEGVGVCKAGKQTCTPAGSGYDSCEGMVGPQIENCSTSANESCVPACGDLLWAKRLGGGGRDGANAAAADSLGNVYVVGYFRGTVDFGDMFRTSQGDDDAFIVKLDPKGDVLWSRTFGGGATDAFTSVAVDNTDEIVVTASFPGPVDLGMGGGTVSGAFLLKFHPQGGFMGFGTKAISSVGPMVVDLESNIYHAVFGTDVGSGQSVTPGHYVVKRDVAGNRIWHQLVATSASLQVSGLAVDTQGNVAIIGVFQDPIEVDGEMVTSVGGDDVVVATLGPTGAHRWHKRLGSPGADTTSMPAFDPMGNVALGVESSEFIDFGGGPVPGGATIVQLGPDGGWRWNTQPPSGTGRYLATDAAGSLVGTGTFAATKLDSNGKKIWYRTYSGSGVVGGGSGITVDRLGNVFVVGNFEGTMQVGQQSLTSEGPAFDVFVVKVAP